MIEWSNSDTPDNEWLMLLTTYIIFTSLDLNTMIRHSGISFTAPNHMIWEIRIGVVFLRGCGLPI